MAAPLIPAAKGVANPDQVDGLVDQYLNFHDDNKEDHNALRKSRYTEMINQYYDMATDFYEWGWGTSFHFAPRYKGENFYASIARAEHYLALKLKLEPGMKVLDVGCGVGGPARAIARFSRALVTGVNNNQYQLSRAAIHTAREGLTHLLSWEKADFMHLPFEDNTFDAIYQIEATAHAPDKTACYKEIMRVLKPGGLFASYEWCLTDLFNPADAQHLLIKKYIEEGDGLPDISTTQQVKEALIEAGYELLEDEDRGILENPNADLPWYHPLEPRYTLSGIQHTPVGRAVTSHSLRLLEAVRLVPKGTFRVQDFLTRAADGLVAGGRLGIFTPSFFTLARKPLE